MTVVERAKEIGAGSLAADREFQMQLQAPIPDALLSWKPGNVWKAGNGALAIFYSYIDDAILRERLDNVCGMLGWEEEYTDKENLTVCTLNVSFPSGEIKTAEGVAYFKDRKDDDGNSEKGSRTMAFRDACKHLGIGGRDTDGAQTRPVAVDAYESNGKLYVREVLEPLSRAILRHSGQSSYRLPAYIRSIVHNTADPDLMRNLDTQAAERSEQQLAATLDMTPPPPGSAQGTKSGGNKPAKKERGDYKDPTYVWEFGKFKGKTIAETDEGYLKWCEEKADFCNPSKADKYDEWLHNLVSYHLHSRAGKELEAAGETNSPWVEVKKEKPGRMSFARAGVEFEQGAEGEAAMFAGEISDSDIPEGM